MQLNRNKAGFTLLEMMLSIALLTIILAVSNPIYFFFKNRNDLDLSSDLVVNSLRRAQIEAQGVDLDSTWGVYVQNSGVSVFKGNTYASRDQSYDEYFDFPTAITVSGPQEIVFSKTYGEPNIIGIISLISPNNETRTVEINRKGGLIY